MMPAGLILTPEEMRELFGLLSVGGSGLLSWGDLRPLEIPRSKTSPAVAQHTSHSDAAIAGAACRNDVISERSSAALGLTTQNFDRKVR